MVVVRGWRRANTIPSLEELRIRSPLAINFGIFGSGRFNFAGLSTLSLLVFLCALPTLLQSLSFLFEPKTKSFLRRHCFQQLPLLTLAAQRACNHSRESLLGRQFRKRSWKQSVENNLEMIANNLKLEVFSGQASEHSNVTR